MEYIPETPACPFPQKNLFHIKDGALPCKLCPGHSNEGFENNNN
jgi:hypothetical protein